jgi:hypothetical protein
MAAAVIPIIAAATPLLRPIIKGLISGAQRIFGHNNGTGATKAQTVIDAALTVAEKLATAGKIPGHLDAAFIASLVEALVQEMKAAGELPTDGAPTGIPSPQGQPVTILGTIHFGSKQ